jgi:uncharacterized membrane protein YidH (DUF202 family)
MSRRDRGLQPERTSLAWQRTSLSAAVAMAFLLRDGIVHKAPVEIVAAGCLAGAVGLTAVVTARPPMPAGTSRLMLLLLTAVVVAAGALIVAWLLWSGPVR